jgi:hypothetical protein
MACPKNSPLRGEREKLQTPRLFAGEEEEEEEEEERVGRGEEGK